MIWPHERKLITALSTNGIMFDVTAGRSYCCMGIVKGDDHMITWDSYAMAKGQPWENGSYYHDEVWGEEDV